MEGCTDFFVAGRGRLLLGVLQGCELLRVVACCQWLSRVVLGGRPGQKGATPYLMASPLQCAATPGPLILGLLQDGRPHGYGLYEWLSIPKESSSPQNVDEAPYQVENVYKGLFKEGKKHGDGVCYFADGSVYEGKWIEDKKVRANRSGQRGKDVPAGRSGFVQWEDSVRGAAGAASRCDVRVCITHTLHSKSVIGLSLCITERLTEGYGPQVGQTAMRLAQASGGVQGSKCSPKSVGRLLMKKATQTAEDTRPRKRQAGKRVTVQSMSACRTGVPRKVEVEVQGPRPRVFLL